MGARAQCGPGTGAARLRGPQESPSPDPFPPQTGDPSSGRGARPDCSQAGRAAGRGAGRCNLTGEPVVLVRKSARLQSREAESAPLRASFPAEPRFAPREPGLRDWTFHRETRLLPGLSQPILCVFFACPVTFLWRGWGGGGEGVEFQIYMNARTFFFSVIEDCFRFLEKQSLVCS